VTSPHSIWNPEPEELARHRRRLRARRRKLLLKLVSRIPSAPFRVLPDFLIIGAAKSATTTLYAYLEQSPHVAWSLRKEAFYFNQTFHWGLNWYRAFFPLRSAVARQAREVGGTVLTGEGSPDYIFHPHAARRVHETLPNAKLVAILRNPTDRAYSFYKHQIMRTNEPLTFEEAVDAEEGRLAGELEKMERDERYASFARQHHSYKARGCYMEQLDGWLAHFPREQILVLITDDLQREPQAAVTELTEFLGLPPIEVQVPKRTHEGVRIDPMGEDVRERLVDYFRPHNARLAEFLGRELNWDR
jgi:hypothetical protein